MAITRTELTKGSDTTDAATYTTASVTLTSGRLYVMGIYTVDTGDTAEAISSIATTGGAISFAAVDSSLHGFNFRRLSLWSVVAGSTVTATIVITMADVNDACHWILLEYTGFDTTTPLGTPVKTSIDGTTSLSVTPGALASTDSFQLAFGAVAATGAPTDTFSGTGWTKIGTTTETGGPNMRMHYAENTSGTAQQVTMSNTNSLHMALMAVEIRAAGGGGSTQPPRTMHQFRQRR